MKRIVLISVLALAACATADAPQTDEPVPSRAEPAAPASSPAATASPTRPAPAQDRAAPAVIKPAASKPAPATPARVKPEARAATPTTNASNPVLSEPSDTTIGWWFVYGGNSRFCGDSSSPQVTRSSHRELMEQCRAAYGYARSLGGCVANAEFNDKTRPEKGVRWKGAGGDAPILAITEDERDAYLFCERGRGRGPAYDGGATPRGRQLAVQYCEAQSGRKCRL